MKKRLIVFLMIASMAATNVFSVYAAGFESGTGDAIDPEASMDAAVGTGIDAGSEDSFDAGVEEGIDTSAEDSFDAGVEEGIDTSAEDSFDAGVEESIEETIEDAGDGVEDAEKIESDFDSSAPGEDLDEAAEEAADESDAEEALSGAEEEAADESDAEETLSGAGEEDAALSDTVEERGAEEAAFAVPADVFLDDSPGADIYEDTEEEISEEFRADGSNENSIGGEIGYPNAADMTWVLEGTQTEGYTLHIQGSGDMMDFVDNGEINTAPWFDYADSIHRAVVDDGVNSLGENVFANLEYLTEVELSSSVTYISAFAFSDCDRLRQISLPDQVTYMGGGAFYNCISLVDVELPSSLRRIGSGTLFMGCRKLESVVMPQGVINNNPEKFYSFTGCSSLKEVLIPSDALRVDLADCSSLTEINLGDQVRDLDLSGCGSLVDVVIPDSVTSLNLSGCTGLENVCLPAGMTIISAGLVEGCTNLRSITMGTEVTAIGERAFSGCGSLEAVSMPDTVTAIGDNAFSGCTGLTHITLPAGLKELGECAFEGCTGLRVLRIPEGMTALGSQAFYECTGLTSVSLPSTLKQVNDYSFASCTKLKTISIPEGVEVIGDSAFSGCTGLTTVTIPAGVKTICDYAFDSCTSLARINILGPVESIGDCAFDTYGESEELRYVFFYGSQAEWDAYGIDYLPDSTKVYYITVPIKTFKPNSSRITVGKGEPAAFRPSFSPSNASCREFSYVIEDSSIISYNKSTGWVTGLKVGQTTITAISYEGGYRATAEVTVIPNIADAIVTNIENKVYNGQHQVQDPVVKMEVDGTTYLLREGVDYSLHYQDNVNPGIANVAIVGTGTNYTGRKDVSFLIRMHTPELGTIKNTTNGVKITWGEVPEARVYAILRNNGTGWSHIGVTKELSFTDKRVTSGENYTYSVVCAESNGISWDYLSDFDRIGLSIKYLATPLISAISNASTAVRLEWDAVKGAEKYAVLRKAADGSWTRIGITDGTTYVDRNVTSGKEYTYTLRCIDADGESYTSSYNTNGRTITFIERPALPTLKNTRTGVEVSWTAVPGAAKYAVLKKTGTVSWTLASVVSGTIFTDVNVKSGTKYSYTIRCLEKDGKTYCSTYNSTGRSIKYFEVPSAVTVVNTALGAQVAWKKSQGSPRYRIYRKEGSGSWKSVGNSTRVSFIDKAAPAGKSAQYIVCCVDSTNTVITSAYSTAVKNCYLQRPALISFTSPKAGSFRMVWSNKLGGTQVQYSRSSSYAGSTTGTVSFSSATSSYTLQALTRGGRYYARVRSYYTVAGKKYYSAWSASKSVIIK